MSLYQELAKRLREGEFNYAFSISLKHKYVYVENAKAACTAIKSMLGEWEFAGCKLGSEIPPSFLKNVHVNVLGTPFVKPFQLGEQLFEDIMRSDEYLRFSFVRNPFARLLSAYLDKIVRRTQESGQIIQEARSQGIGRSEDDLSFADFLRCIGSITSRRGFLDKHWRPQSQQLFQEAIRYDFIGKVERLEQDMAHLATTLGHTFSDLQRKYGHETRASSHIANYYDDEARALVLDLYHGDFEEFGYDKALPS